MSTSRPFFPVFDVNSAILGVSPRIAASKTSLTGNVPFGLLLVRLIALVLLCFLFGVVAEAKQPVFTVESQFWLSEILSGRLADISRLPHANQMRKELRQLDLVERKKLILYLENVQDKQQEKIKQSIKIGITWLK